MRVSTASTTFVTHTQDGALEAWGIVALRSYPTLSRCAFAATLVVRETAPKPRLLNRVRHAIEARHYSRRTEKAYVHWIKRYIFFHGKRHPAEMGTAEVTAFLTSLAVPSKVAASPPRTKPSALYSSSIARCSAWNFPGSTTSSEPNGPCICPWC